jgi:folate-dependent phosphoribosylglycinamide formyltransferase PurN
MAKLIGNKNISVFISGRGSNLKALINYEKKNKKFKIS